ncbi:MAG: PHP domain-containing protein [Thermaerobacter sp.]|nr:PHP domain-containing protein [Thermaerobacter sp.]
MAERSRSQRADLHLHSTASDGLLPPDVLASAVHKAQIAVAAITDHDTTAGYAAFAAAARPLSILPIAGAEIATLHAGEEIHLLAYFPAVPAGIFAALLDKLSEERRTRAEEMLRRLREIGIALPDAGEILAHPQVGRPHVARALVRIGLARDTAEAFSRYLTPGTPAYVERFRPDAVDALEQVHAERGIVSLAHPAHYRLRHLGDLAQAGLDAVEVNHPSASRAQRQALRREARSLGLLVTGGSDFHGVQGAAPGDAALGRADTERFVERLLGHSVGS